MSIDLTILRKKMQDKRKNLSMVVQKKASASIANAVINSDIFNQSQHIAFYYAYNGEINPNAIVKQAWTEHKQCYLPVIATDNSQTLWFVPYGPNDKLVVNRFNILEPTRLEEKISANKLDLVITPLVAFDDNNNRLGMGKGYYDRTFHFSKQTIKPYLLGLAYHFQRVEQLTSKEWDIPLHRIITDKQTTIRKNNEVLANEI